MFTYEICKNELYGLGIIATRKNDEYCIQKEQGIDPKAILEIKIQYTASASPQISSNQGIDHSYFPWARGDRDFSHHVPYQSGY